MEPLQTGLVLASACKFDDKTDALAERISYVNGAEAELSGEERVNAGEDTLIGNTSGAKLLTAAFADRRRSEEVGKATEHEASFLIKWSECRIA